MGEVWKFDVDGNCVDQLNEPGEGSFADKVHIKRYPTLEMGGIVWTYMGPADKQPPPPCFEFTQVRPPQTPQGHRECNWLQALEATSIASSAPSDAFGGPGSGAQGGRSRVPHVHPCAARTACSTCAEERCGASQRRRRRREGRQRQPDHDHVDQSTFRAVRNASNNWGIDRQVQKSETYSGIEGVNTQDRAVQESMGPVVDRSEEYLGPADKAIISMRRLLLQAIKSVQAGEDPPAVDTSYYNLRAIERIVADDVQWRDTILPLMYPASQPARELVGMH